MKIPGGARRDETRALVLKRSSVPWSIRTLVLKLRRLRNKVQPIIAACIQLFVLPSLNCSAAMAIFTPESVSPLTLDQ